MFRSPWKDTMNLCSFSLNSFSCFSTNKAFYLFAFFWTISSYLSSNTLILSSAMFNPDIKLFTAKYSVPEKHISGSFIKSSPFYFFFMVFIFIKFDLTISHMYVTYTSTLPPLPAPSYPTDLSQSYLSVWVLIMSFVTSFSFSFWTTEFVYLVPLIRLSVLP